MNTPIQMKQKQVTPRAPKKTQKQRVRTGTKSVVRTLLPHLNDAEYVDSVQEKLKENNK